MAVVSLEFSKDFEHEWDTSAVYARPRINDIGGKRPVIIDFDQAQRNLNVSALLIVLDGVLDDMEHGKLVERPICAQLSSL